jgi:hypothetical protein
VESLTGISPFLDVPHPSMDTYTYPGKGLSLSQLIFALNEELKHVTYSSSYVAEDHCGLASEVLRNDPLTFAAV